MKQQNLIFPTKGPEWADKRVPVNLLPWLESRPYRGGTVPSRHPAYQVQAVHSPTVGEQCHPGTQHTRYSQYTVFQYTTSIIPLCANTKSIGLYRSSFNGKNYHRSIE